MRNGRPVKIWIGKGDKGPALDILNGLRGEADRSGWPMEARRISALLSFWRDTAFGYCDNYRLALIHQDNSFEFLEYDHAGQVRREKSLPVEAIAPFLTEIAREILGGLRNERALGFVARHAASLFGAFHYR